MASWSKNNMACRATWSTLLVLDQTDKPFPDAGKVKIKNLLFFNAADSADVKKLKRTTLCRQIDNVFRMLRGAEFEDGVTRAKALRNMSAVFRDGDKTIADLAEKNDANYDFLGEEDLVGDA